MNVIQLRNVRDARVHKITYASPYELELKLARWRTLGYVVDSDPPMRRRYVDRFDPYAPRVPRVATKRKPWYH